MLYSFRQRRVYIFSIQSVLGWSAYEVGRGFGTFPPLPTSILYFSFNPFVSLAIIWAALFYGAFTTLFMWHKVSKHNLTKGVSVTETEEGMKKTD